MIKQIRHLTYHIISYDLPRHHMTTIDVVYHMTTIDVVHHMTTIDVVHHMTTIHVVHYDNNTCTCKYISCT